VDIKSVGNIGSSRYFEASKVQDKPKSSEPLIKDSVDLSTEAKNIATRKVTTDSLEAIKARVKNNYYDRPEVIEKVVDAIYNELS